MVIYGVREVLKVLLCQDLSVASRCLVTSRIRAVGFFSMSAAVAVSGKQSVFGLSASPVLSEIPIEVGGPGVGHAFDLPEYRKPFVRLINLRFLTHGT